MLYAALMQAYSVLNPPPSAAMVKPPQDPRRYYFDQLPGGTRLFVIESPDEAFCFLHVRVQMRPAASLALSELMLRAVVKLQTAPSNRAWQQFADFIAKNSGVLTVNFTARKIDYSFTVKRSAFARAFNLLLDAVLNLEITRAKAETVLTLLAADVRASAKNDDAVLDYLQRFLLGQSPPPAGHLVALPEDFTPARFTTGTSVPS